MKQKGSILKLKTINDWKKLTSAFESQQCCRPCWFWRPRRGCFSSSKRNRTTCRLPDSKSEVCLGRRVRSLAQCSCSPSLDAVACWGPWKCRSKSRSDYYRWDTNIWGFWDRRKLLSLWHLEYFDWDLELIIKSLDENMGFWYKIKLLLTKRF